jgi:hypothetical protein
MPELWRADIREQPILHLVRCSRLNRGGARRERGLIQSSLKKRSDTMQAHCASRCNWSPDQLPAWLTIEVYTAQIQSLLRNTSRTVIQRALGVSPLYARKVATGEVIPHKMHWVKFGGVGGSED